MRGCGVLYAYDTIVYDGSTIKSMVESLYRWKLSFIYIGDDSHFRFKPKKGAFKNAFPGGMKTPLGKPIFHQEYLVIR